MVEWAEFKFGELSSRGISSYGGRMGQENKGHRGLGSVATMGWHCAEDPTLRTHTPVFSTERRMTGSFVGMECF